MQRPIVVSLLAQGAFDDEIELLLAVGRLLLLKRGQPLLFDGVEEALRALRNAELLPVP